MKSLLTPGQRKLFLFLFGFSVFILANSFFLFLASPTETDSKIVEARYQVSTYGAVGTQPIETAAPLKDPDRALPKFYQTMLASHVLGGLALMAAALAFVFWHIGPALKIRNNKAILYGIALTAAMLLLAFSGLFILTEANSAKHRWIFWSHRIFAVLIVFFYLGHRLKSATPPERNKIAYGLAITMGLVLLFLGIHKVQKDGFAGLLSLASIARDANAGEYVEAADNNSIRDPFIPLKPTNLSQPESYFFPSSSSTSTGNPLPSRTLTQEDLSNADVIKNDIEKYGFVVNDSMGSATCARCHAGIVEQWAKSTHRFSSFNNPFYKASVDRIREEENGKVRSHWCGSCHDPVLMFGGKMRQDVDPHWPEAQAGLTCLACHTIDKVHGKEANGNYNISDEQPSPYIFADAKSGMARTLHDMVLKSKPTVHKQMMLQPFYRTSEYCMSCHKVSLDTPINHYRWLRGQNDYDAWHNSGVAHNAARTFYLPPQKKNCQDCHMPLEAINQPDVSAKNGMVKSHRFLAVNNALPFIRDDQGSMKYIENFVKNKVIIDVFALNRTTSVDPIPVKNISALQAGEEVQVDVVVRNHGVGHTFPAGTNDSNEAWIDFQVADDSGKVYFRSGAIGPDGHVDPEAHFYKALFVDKHSQAALKRNPQNFHVLVYSRVIGPGTADVVRYQFRVPEEAAGQNLKVTANLYWRKFNRHYTEFVFQHEKLPALPQFEGVKVPDLPVILISSSEAVFLIQTLDSTAAGLIASASESNPKAESDPRPEWMRYNDYGIGHLQQGDFRSADWAFAQVASLVPQQVDGPRNLARVALQEGRMEEVYSYLEQCEKIKPGDAQTAWFWALAKKKDGDYIEAISALKRVLAYFPEDREAWNELGRTHYLNGEYPEALQADLELLQIDPESAIGHYYRMLCYRAMGEQDKAAEAEKAYLKYQIDETAAEVTQKYRLEQPIDNRESQPLHVHDFSEKEMISQAK